MLRAIMIVAFILFAAFHSSACSKPVTGPWVNLVYSGSPDDIDAYLSRGGDIEKNVFDGDTPILFAASSQRWDLVLRLIEHGANLSVRGGSGVTLGELAATSNVKLRSERGAYLQEVRSILKMKGLMESRDYYEEVRRERGARKMKELRELRERQQQ